MALGNLHYSLSIFTMAVLALMPTASLRSVGGDAKLALRSRERELVANASDHLRHNSTVMENCQKLHYADPPLPVTILASSPGSGNTWLRHLLQQATGILTGSIFHDVNLLSEFPAENVTNGSVVVVKMHDARHMRRVMNCSRVILLVRNPFRAVFSDFHRTITEGNHTGIAPKELLEKQTINTTLTERWYIKTALWLERWDGPMLIVSYEKLEKYTKAVMKKILDFLELKVSNDNLLCMLRNSEGNFHRQQIPMKPEMFSDVENITRSLNGYASKLNKKLEARFGIRINTTIPSELQL